MRRRAVTLEAEQPKKRVATNGHRLPDPIRIGEILTDVTKKQWRLGRSIGVGGFGEIYLACDNINKPVGTDAKYVIKVEPHNNGPLFVEMNFYVRAAKSDMVDEWMEQNKLKGFGMPRFIGLGSHIFKNMRYRFLVLDRFGEDLDKLFLRNGRQFHIKTVLTLGLQIVDILKYIHSQGYIHADIKGSNLLLGCGNKNQVYLLDYGLACHYLDSTGTHKEYGSDERRAHRGTIEFTSRDAHIGACSRRGDLEILGYNLLQWSSGKLPWEKHADSPVLVQEMKKVFMLNIPELLRTCFPKSQPPSVLGQFFKYVTSLEFEANPNYAYCKKILHQGIKDAGYIDDGLLEFDDPDTIPKAKKVKKRGVKRHAMEEPENLTPVKRLAIVSPLLRKPCVVQNFNRMTRNSAPSPVLNSFHRQFSWEEVLSSNPERQLKKQLQRKTSTSTAPLVTPLAANQPPEKKLVPTQAMLDVIARRWRQASADRSSDKKGKVRSCCVIPSIPDYGRPYTPAMERVIQRDMELQRLALDKSCDSSEDGKTSTLLLRSGRKRLTTPTRNKKICRTTTVAKPVCKKKEISKKKIENSRGTSKKIPRKVGVRTRAR